MIEEIEIENFRCFEHTKISGFERVNLIGGKNNSGKTALLEALLIYAVPTDRSILEIEQIRKKSLDFVKSLPDRAWDDLFFNQNKASAIRIVGKKGEENSKIIEIMIGNVADLDEKDVEILTKLYRENASISVLAIEIVENKEEKMQYPLIATSDGIFRSKSSDTANTNIFPMVPASFIISSKKLTEEYDKARLDDKEGEILKGFKILDPSIEAVESFSIGEPALYLKRKNQKRLPLSLFGDAINKMAVIILALINNNNKILLIDEIENGIHYTNQREFWDNLFRLSIEYDIQIFATTHSLEMIQAFVDTGLNYKEAGAYFELARSSKTDRIIGIKRELETLDYALKHDKGVRGE